MSGLSGLHVDACNGRVDRLLWRLRERGEDLHVHDSTALGWTPLHWAAAKGHEKVIEVLVKAGARVGTTNRPNTTRAGKLKAGAGKGSSTPLHLAAEGGHFMAVDALLVAGADPNAGEGRTLTPLHMAAKGGHDEVAGLLIEAGANIEAVDWEGRTPLHVAAHHGQEALCNLLVEQGADARPELRTDGRTPLHLASRQGHEYLAGRLIVGGARDTDGWMRREAAGGENAPRGNRLDPGRVFVPRAWPNRPFAGMLGEDARSSGMAARIQGGGRVGDDGRVGPGGRNLVNAAGIRGQGMRNRADQKL